MKKNIIVAGVLLASSTVFALDTDYFIGAGFERMKGDVSATATSTATINGVPLSSTVSTTETLKDNGVRLKAGVILNNAHRISLNHSMHSEEGIDLDLSTVNYDYMIALNQKFNFLVGAHLGQADCKVENSVINMDGLAYGVQTGITYYNK